MSVTTKESCGIGLIFRFVTGLMMCTGGLYVCLNGFKISEFYTRCGRVIKVDAVYICVYNVN